MATYTVAAYRVVLERLRHASRVLAEQMAALQACELGLTGSPEFIELWADYKRALAESQDFYRRIPARLKVGAPRPPL